jgi:hypothetical protein
MFVNTFIFCLWNLMLIIDIVLYSIYMYIQQRCVHTHICMLVFIFLWSVYIILILLLLLELIIGNFFFVIFLSEHQSLAEPSSNQDLNLIFLTFFHVIVHSTQLYIKLWYFFSFFVKNFTKCCWSYELAVSIFRSFQLSLSVKFCLFFT